MVVIRRDFLRKLKHRSSKDQTQEQQRTADLFSIENELLYTPKSQEGELTQSDLLTPIKPI